MLSNHPSNPEQIQQLLITAIGHPHEARFHQAVTTGLRAGEILGLKWSDVDWDRGWLRVQRQVQRVPANGIVFSGPKTQFGNRVLAIRPTTLERLKQHQERQKLDQAVAGTHSTDMDLIFPSTKGTPVSLQLHLTAHDGKSLPMRKLNPSTCGGKTISKPHIW